jgi:hypothetical protein
MQHKGSHVAPGEHMVPGLFHFWCTWECPSRFCVLHTTSFSLVEHQILDVTLWIYSRASCQVENYFKTLYIYSFFQMLVFLIWLLTWLSGIVMITVW